MVKEFASKADLGEKQITFWVKNRLRSAGWRIMPTLTPPKVIRTPV